MPDELDRILASEEHIEPSAMFAAKVMHAVRREASQPPPLPFPWKRAVPGFAAGAVLTVLMAIEHPSQVDATAVGAAWLDAAVRLGLGWLALALLLPLAACGIARRLTAK